jgi:zinc transport system substrate-binding protein
MLALLALGVTGCQDSAEPTQAAKPLVVAGFYPLAFVAEQVGGAAVVVENLTSPGVEPHDLELRASQVGDLTGASLVVYLRGMQPAVDEAVAQANAERALDVTRAVPLEDTGAPLEEEPRQPATLAGDPHIWLDPVRMGRLTEVVADRLAVLVPDQAGDIARRAQTLQARFAELHRAYERGLRDCARREIVTSHAAFGYLAARYGLSQIPIAGLTPEAEPSLQRLQEIEEIVRSRGVTTIFFETLASPDLATTIAADTGARTAVLDPIEGTDDPMHADYLTLMRANLNALRQALSCA